jgi:hypothetical protein
MAPILGQYPFVSMSVDDVFVLSRLLPTSVELFHYLSVRQRVAGQVDAAYVDELDHLGTYITQNRVDMLNEEQFAQGVALLMHAGASKVVDDYFMDPEWASKPPPRQPYPELLQKFLAANDAARWPTFLLADAILRDFSTEWRQQLQERISKLLPTLKEHPSRWTVIAGETATLVWLQRTGHDDDQAMRMKAEAAALALGLPLCEVVVLCVSPRGEFEGGRAVIVHAPSPSAPSYRERFEEGQKMMGRSAPLRPGVMGGKRMRK